MKSDPISPLNEEVSRSTHSNDGKNGKCEKVGKVDGVNIQNVGDDLMCQPCDDDEEEAEVQLGVRTPAQPSRAEREEHELSHFPYRSWCDHCVRGRAKDDPPPEGEGCSRRV